jgi:hypothetical protein
MGTGLPTFVFLCVQRPRVFQRRLFCVEIAQTLSTWAYSLSRISSMFPILPASTLMFRWTDLYPCICNSML